MKPGIPISRRDFLLSTGCSVAALYLFSPEAAAGWESVPEILARIRAPVFPKRDFEITRYGAAGDGVRDCTEAFVRAVEECHRAGGGRVVVPAGNFLTGAIHLRSNVNLQKGRQCGSYPTRPAIFPRSTPDGKVWSAGAIRPWFMPMNRKI